MSLRITTLIFMVCFAAAQMGIIAMKYSVQNIQREVEATRSQLAGEKDSLHLLKAEWAYLNRPERLRFLASRHLDLVPLDSRRINDVAVLPAVAQQPAAGPSFDGLFQPANQLVEGR